VWNWSNPRHEALQGEIMSRSESEPDSASLEISESGQSSKSDEACHPVVEKADEAAIGLSGVLGGGA
jgi:hypothetical protein